MSGQLKGLIDFCTSKRSILQVDPQYFILFLCSGCKSLNAELPSISAELKVDLVKGWGNRSN